MTTEFVIAHKWQRTLWSSLTFVDGSNDVQVYVDGNVYNMTRESAELSLQYCRQSDDYIVEKISDYVKGKAR